VLHVRLGDGADVAARGADNVDDRAGHVDR
jgi:hypothetical protein